MSDAPECPHCGGNPSGSATFELSCCPLAYRDTVEAALRDAKKQIAELQSDYQSLLKWYWSALGEQ